MEKTSVDRKKSQGKVREMSPRTPARLGLVWLKAFLNEGSPTFLNAAASARRAGYRGRNAHCFEEMGHKNRIKYGPMIARWLDDHGYSETDLKIKVLQLMEAKETVFQRMRGTVDQGTLPEGHKVAAITDEDTLLEIDVAALGIQIKALELALRVKGLFAADRIKHSGVVSTTILQLTDEDRALLRKVIDASAQKLMYAGREAVLQLGPGVPQVVTPEGTKRPEKTLPAVGTPGGVT
jgi:hypothetical protein